jgi:hypothetical protein
MSQTEGAKRGTVLRAGQRATGSKQGAKRAGGFACVLKLDSSKRDAHDVLFCTSLDYKNKTLIVLRQKTLALAKCFVLYGCPR